MIGFLILLLQVLVSPFKTRAHLEAEIVLLRHQLGVLRQRVPSRPKLTLADRLVFVWLYRLFPSLLDAVTIVQPETVIRWHRKGFRLYWRWRSRSRGGRPRLSGEIRRLIREMSLANRLWGAPRIHGELLKLGIDVAQSTVAKYMARSGRGAVADLEDIPGQPFGRHRGDGFPDRADGWLSLALRSGHSEARAAAADLPEHNGASDCRLDRPSDHRCVPVGRSTRVHDPGP